MIKLNVLKNNQIVFVENCKKKTDVDILLGVSTIHQAHTHAAATTIT